MDQVNLLYNTKMVIPIAITTNKIIKRQKIFFLALFYKRFDG